MEKIYQWKNMSIEMTRIVIVVHLIFLPFVAVFAQDWELAVEIAFDDVDKIAVDQLGNCYVSNPNGDLFKYSDAGVLLNEYSPQTQGSIGQIDLVSSLKVLLFYEGLQEYVLLNRYVSVPIRYSFNNTDFGYISHTSLTLQQNIWVVDATEFSLKLWNTFTKTVDENKSLLKVLDPDKSAITELLTYQNRTYLLDQNSGIYIFDSIGNFLQKISISNPKNLGFDGDHLVFESEGKLILMQLYDDSTQVLNFPKGNIKTFQFRNGQLYAVTEKGVAIYKYLRND